MITLATRSDFARSEDKTSYKEGLFCDQFRSLMEAFGEHFCGACQKLIIDDDQTAIRDEKRYHTSCYISKVKSAALADMEDHDCHRSQDERDYDLDVDEEKITQ